MNKEAAERTQQIREELHARGYALQWESRVPGIKLNISCYTNNQISLLLTTWENGHGFELFALLDATNSTPATLAALDGLMPPAER